MYRSPAHPPPVVHFRWMGGWVGRQERRRKSDPQNFTQGWNTLSTNPRHTVRLSLSKPTSSPIPDTAGGQHNAGRDSCKKKPAFPAGSHIIITRYTPPRRIFASPWQHCNPHARYPSCNGPASRGSQAAPPTTLSCGAECTVLISYCWYCHLVQGQHPSTWRTDAIRSAQNHPRVVTDQTIWGPRPAPIALLHAQRNAHAHGDNLSWPSSASGALILPVPSA